MDEDVKSVFKLRPIAPTRLGIDELNGISGVRSTIRGNPAIARPLPVNRISGRSFTLFGVKPLFTSPKDEVRRTTRWCLSVRVSCGKRSLLGKIVVILQRRLALARPGANPAKGTPCN